MKLWFTAKGASVVAGAALSLLLAGVEYLFAVAGVWLVRVGSIWSAGFGILSIALAFALVMAALLEAFKRL